MINIHTCTERNETMWHEQYAYRLFISIFSSICYNIMKVMRKERRKNQHKMICDQKVHFKLINAG